MFTMSQLPEHRPDLIVFDDFDWDFMRKQYKPWFGTNTDDFTVTDKYKGKRTFKWGKGVPFIWVCNDDNNPLDIEHNGHILKYLETNTDVIRITNKLY